jgi:hypothetical protein
MLGPLLQPLRLLERLTGDVADLVEEARVLPDIARNADRHVSTMDRDLDTMIELVRESNRKWDVIIEKMDLLVAGIDDMQRTLHHADGDLGQTRAAAQRLVTDIEKIPGI